MKKIIVLLATMCVLNVFGMPEADRGELHMAYLRTMHSPSGSSRAIRGPEINQSALANGAPVSQKNKAIHFHVQRNGTNLPEDEEEDTQLPEGYDHMGMPVGIDASQYEAHYNDTHGDFEYRLKSEFITNGSNDATGSASASAKTSRSGALSPAAQAQQPALKAIQESPQRQAAPAHAAVQPLPVAMPANAQQQPAATPARQVTVSTEQPVVHLIPVRPQPSNNKQATLMAQCCVIL